MIGTADLIRLTSKFNNKRSIIDDYTKRLVI